MGFAHPRVTTMPVKETTTSPPTPPPPLPVMPNLCTLRAKRSITMKAADYESVTFEFEAASVGDEHSQSDRDALLAHVEAGLLAQIRAGMPNVKLGNNPGPNAQHWKGVTS